MPGVWSVDFRILLFFFHSLLTHGMRYIGDRCQRNVSKARINVLFISSFSLPYSQEQVTYSSAVEFCTVAYCFSSVENSTSLQGFLFVRSSCLNIVSSTVRSEVERILLRSQKNIEVNCGSWHYCFNNLCLVTFPQRCINSVYTHNCSLSHRSIPWMKNKGISLWLSVCLKAFKFWT